MDGGGLIIGSIDGSRVAVAMVVRHLCALVV